MFDYMEGMRRFHNWFVSGYNCDHPLHREFARWGDLSARDNIRALYSVAHGTPLLPQLPRAIMFP